MRTDLELSAPMTAKDAADPKRRAALIARFGEKAYRLWCEASHPQHLTAPTAIGTADDAAGNRVSIALGIYGETIVQTDFDAEGCPAAKIAAATAAHWAHGKDLAEAAAMDEQAIQATLGDFPRDARGYARLAVEAVREAVARWKGAFTRR
ncbi:MAG: iron-sulfur cluster assembly scaffold protein [Solidesulfovibrio sp. DCME]|uniref:iron-sulfur cluster assembly scaffold protein n=1 Tax=Solidesulfovibrio sp. DCME TaxID=3447380 RepID=UPI003D0FE75E